MTRKQNGNGRIPFNRRRFLRTASVAGVSLAGLLGSTESGLANQCDVVVPDDEATIQDGVDAANAGATVCVKNGTYAEQVNIGKPVAIIGDTGGATPGPGSSAPVLDGQNQLHHGFGIGEGTTDVTIRGFEITRYRLSNGIGVGIGGTRRTARVTIEDNFIHDIGTQGIHSATEEQGHDGWSIRANVVENAPNGINLNHISDSKVVGNSVTMVDQGIIVGAGGSGTSVADVRVEANKLCDGDVGLRVGPGVDAGEVSATENTIVGNDDFGALNTGSGTLDAERNWWGARTGPERDAGKSDRTVGDGDRVSDGVDFRPWLTREP